MSSFKQIYLHIVFGTKNRKPVISEEHEKKLYQYIYGIIKGHQCKLYRINGTSDHIHLLSDLHPTVSIANYMKDIKISSSKWMKESGLFPLFTNWQVGNGAFSVSHSGRDAVIDYIINQKIHHLKESFEQEFKRLLTEHGIAYDERYLFE